MGVFFSILVLFPGLLLFFNTSGHAKDGVRSIVSVYKLSKQRYTYNENLEIIHL